MRTKLKNENREIKEDTMATMTRKNVLTKEWKNGYYACKNCGGLIEEDSEWLGEDEDGIGTTRLIHRCEDCGHWSDEIQKGG